MAFLIGRAYYMEHAFTKMIAAYNLSTLKYSPSARIFLEMTEFNKGLLSSNARASAKFQGMTIHFDFTITPGPLFLDEDNKTIICKMAKVNTKVLLPDNLISLLNMFHVKHFADQLQMITIFDWNKENKTLLNIPVIPPPKADTKLPN